MQGPAQDFEATIISGTYNTQLGTINLVAISYYDRNNAGTLTLPVVVDLGAVRLRNVRYATFDQNLEVDRKSKVTFFAGGDLSQDISVNMLTPGASVALDSRLIPGNIDIQATNIEFNAVVDAQSRIDLGYGTQVAQNNLPFGNVANRRSPRRFKSSRKQYSTNRR